MASNEEQRKIFYSLDHISTENALFFTIRKLWNKKPSDCESYKFNEEKFFYYYRSKIIKILLSKEMRETCDNVHEAINEYINSNPPDESSEINYLAKNAIATYKCLSDLPDNVIANIYDKAGNIKNDWSNSALLLFWKHYFLDVKQLVRFLGQMSRTEEVGEHVDDYLASAYVLKASQFYFEQSVCNIMFNSENNKANPNLIVQVRALFNYIHILFFSFISDEFGSIGGFFDFGIYRDNFLKIAVIAFLEGQITMESATYSHGSLESIASLHGKMSVEERRWKKHKQQYYPIIALAVEKAKKLWESGCTLKNDKMLKKLLNDKEFVQYRDKIEWRLKEELKKIAAQYGLKRTIKRR